ncbi:Uncharacterised protein [Serratia plymuthica]|nr:hypothetical protein Q5A_024530 [Serratia inhibens PRI-2C]VEA69076.1 Uncharacterised protein [Serratia plymuthica]VEI21722.1 Uncharacterised protein [Serratia plymuthica]
MATRIQNFALVSGEVLNVSLIYLISKRVASFRIPEALVYILEV